MSAQLTHAHEVIKIGSNSSKILSSCFSIFLLNSYDKARIKLLTKMLDVKQWRFLSTLSRVIGADEDTTRRLLIEAGARSSEKERTDEEEPWGLISKNPIGNIE
jgi:hypothetical protein